MEKGALNELSRLIFAQALEDCSIEKAFAEKVKVMMMENGAKSLLFGPNRIDLARVKYMRVVALGKASRAMLEALLPRLPLPMHCDLAGVLIGPEQPEYLPPDFQYFAGGHPFPNEASFAGARAVLQMLQALPESTSDPSDVLCLFLISGGASAMMELPLDPSISLADTIAFHRALVHSGASIAEMNCIRKHFSAVKGGRLALAAKGSECFTLLVSDVPAGHLNAISSGPTMPDPSTVEECREILLRYGLFERFPASVRRFFASSELLETPKPETLSARAWTLLNADDLAEAARRRAEQLGFHAVIDNTCDDWDYRAAADYLLSRLRALRRDHPSVSLISAGEIAVPLRGIAGAAGEYVDSAPGIGGRNQHFALYAATLLDDADKPIAILSAGSDGIDGNSRVAGAVIDERTLRNINSDNMNAAVSEPDEELYTEARSALHHFYSSTFLQDRGAVIVTGPTGNNLRDLRIFLAEGPSSLKSKNSAHQNPSAG